MPAGGEINGRYFTYPWAPIAVANPFTANAVVAPQAANAAGVVQLGVAAAANGRYADGVNFLMLGTVLIGGLLRVWRQINGAGNINLENELYYAALAAIPAGQARPSFY